MYVHRDFVHGAQKVSTGLQMIHGSTEGLYKMRTTPIFVTVGTFETREDHEERKSYDSCNEGGFEAPQITRMATTRSPIHVTASTFEAYPGGWGGIHLRGGG